MTEITLRSACWTRNTFTIFFFENHVFQIEDGHSYILSDFSFKHSYNVLKSSTIKILVIIPKLQIVDGEPLKVVGSTQRWHGPPNIGQTISRVDHTFEPVTTYIVSAYTTNSHGRMCNRYSPALSSLRVCTLIYASGRARCCCFCCCCSFCCGCCCWPHLLLFQLLDGLYTYKR